MGFKSLVTFMSSRLSPIAFMVFSFTK
jgi:hypothetical protein